MEGLADRVCIQIADEIGNHRNLPQLGTELGHPWSKVSAYIDTNNNRSGALGTINMIMDFKRATKPTEQRLRLKQALEETGFAGVANTYLGDKEVNATINQRRRPRKRVSVETSSAEDDREVNATIDQQRSSRKRATKSSEALDPPPLDLRTWIDLRTWNSLAWRTLQEGARERYTDPTRRLVDITQYNPSVQLREGTVRTPLENSLNDIFTCGDDQSTRIILSSDSKGKGTAVSRRLTHNWAVENNSSPYLREQPLVLECDLGKVTEEQDLEDAIKEQVYHDKDDIVGDHIRTLLKDTPTYVTLVLNGFESFQTKGYTGNILRILMGQEMKNVTVLVTSTSQKASLLSRNRHCTYKHIEMA